MYEAREMYKGK